MALITQDEIVSTLPIDDHFSVNNIPNATIVKSELLLANEFLGEDLYALLVADKTGTGTFATPAYQTLYDTYLKTLIAEYVLLSMTTQKVLELSNKGLDEVGSTQLSALQRYKESLNDEVVKSKALADSYMTKSANKATFDEYLGNSVDSTENPIRKPLFGGFVVHDSLKLDTNY